MYSSNNYSTSIYVSFEHAVQALAHFLLKLLSWLTDERAFTNVPIVQSPRTRKSGNMRKCLAQGECMVAKKWKHSSHFILV